MQRAVGALWRVAALVTALAAVPMLPAGAAGRNILLIVADDIGLEATTLYPETLRRPTTPAAVSVPNLERLARRGILFRNAWGNPLCSPTRATIFTGRYGFRTGVGHFISAPRNDPIPALSRSEFGLPEAFAERPGKNYFLAHIGKWHLSRGTNDPNRYGWRYFAGPDPEFSGGRLPSYFTWPKAVNGVASTSTTYATTDSVNEALGAIGRAERQGRPWLVWHAPNAAHGPYHKPPNALHSRDRLPAEGAPSRAYYEAMIEALDTELGRLLARVDLARTTVIFVGDNGTPGNVIARPYENAHAKATLYEDGVRVPLLIAGAGVVQPGRVVSGLANTVDLFPTVLELAGIEPAAVVPRDRPIDGVSLLPYLRNTIGAGSVRPLAYAERFLTTYTDSFRRAIRNRRFKLMEHQTGLRRFFDVVADPHEQRNLLDGPLTAWQTTNLSTLDRALDDLIASR